MHTLMPAQASGSTHPCARRLARRAPAVLVAVAAWFLAGCTNYSATGEGRTAGEVIDDSAIHTRVKASLIGARDLPGWRIDVDVREGVVVLTGQVDREEQRTRAIGIARGTPGVKDVEDRLTVPPDAEPNDSGP